MRVRHLLLAAAGLVVGCADGPTDTTEPRRPSLIVSGQPDAGQHPYVVLLLFFNASGQAWFCSGSLLSSTVAVTAGHCTDGAVAVRAFPYEVPGPGLTSYPGTAYTYSDFCIGCAPGQPRLIQGDVGIVVLSQPVPTSVVNQYAELPTVGLVDALATGAGVDLAGYGVQRLLRGGGPPVWVWNEGRITRYKATAAIVPGEFVHSGTFIRVTANPARGKGGACFGESGGAALLAGTNILIGVISYGPNHICAGVSYSFRVDTPDVLAWILSFL